MKTLRKEHFVENSETFSSTIHQTNMKTFISVRKPEEENKGKPSGKKEGRRPNEAIN